MQFGGDRRRLKWERPALKRACPKVRSGKKRCAVLASWCPYPPANQGVLRPSWVTQKGMATFAAIPCHPHVPPDKKSPQSHPVILYSPVSQMNAPDRKLIIPLSILYSPQTNMTRMRMRTTQRPMTLQSLQSLGSQST